MQHLALSRQPVRTIVGFGLSALLLTALSSCGGGDDEADATTTTVATTIAPSTPTTLAATPTTTAAPIATAPPAVTYVTEGASVIVTNASRVDGGAGRLSERLAAVGFTTVPAANYSLGQIDTSIVYYDPATPAARAVADSLRLAFGGGAIQVLELTSPPPVDSGDLGGAQVLVAMGNDIADKSLEELQGLIQQTTTTVAETSGTDSSTDASGDESSSG